MAKYRLTLNDPDEVLLNLIPAQPEDGYEEGTKVTVNVKFGPVGNLFGSINGESEEIIDRAVYEVIMDGDKTVELKKGSLNPAKVAAPKFTPAAGSVAKGTEVTITCDTEGATIYYTVDGSTPDKTATEYTGPITINVTQTIKAIAYAVIEEEERSSAVKSAVYTVVVPKCATPTFLPSAGTVFSGTEVSISCATDGATIYYTVDGSTPTIESPVYSTPVTVTEAITIKAMAVKEEYDNSSIASAAYTIGVPTVATPTFSPAAGNINKGESVTINCTTDGAEIHYTVDGTVPSASSPVYSAPIVINASQTIKAIGIKTDYNNSSVASATYTVVIPTCAAPTFSPAAGEVTSGTEVTISTTTDGAAIHYTIDGSTPSASSPVYSTPIAITAATTIKAIATKEDYNNSSVSTANYTLAPVTLNYYMGMYNDPEDEGVPLPIDKAFFVNVGEEYCCAWSTSGVATQAAHTFEHVEGDDDSGFCRYCYAYPKELGLLHTYQLVGSIEANIDDSFTRVECTIDDAPYYCYFLTDSVDTNNTGIIFK